MVIRWQKKCLLGDRQITSWWLEDDQLHCLRNGGTKYPLTVSYRRQEKVSSRSNSLCFCTEHTSSYVSSDFFTFRCLVGDTVLSHTLEGENVVNSADAGLPNSWTTWLWIRWLSDPLLSLWSFLYDQKIFFFHFLSVCTNFIFSKKKKLWNVVFRILPIPTKMFFSNVVLLSIM